MDVSPSTDQTKLLLQQQCRQMICPVDHEVSSERARPIDGTQRDLLMAAGFDALSIWGFEIAAAKLAASRFGDLLRPIGPETEILPAPRRHATGLRIGDTLRVQSIKRSARGVKVRPLTVMKPTGAGVDDTLTGTTLRCICLPPKRLTEAGTRPSHRPVSIRRM